MAPIIKLSLTKEEDTALAKMAAEMKLSKQDFLRWRLFNKKPHPIFDPDEALRRALERFTEDDPPFTLPAVYGEEWQLLNPRMAGVVGKRFFNLVSKTEEIEFVSMTSDGRRATYRIKKQ